MGVEYKAGKDVLSEPCYSIYFLFFPQVIVHAYVCVHMIFVEWSRFSQIVANVLPNHLLGFGLHFRHSPSGVS